MSTYPRRSKLSRHVCRVKFGDSRTNCSRDIRAVHCVMESDGRRVYNHTGYDVTTYFRWEVIGVRKWAESLMGRNAWTIVDTGLHSYAVMYASQVAMHLPSKAGKRHRRLKVSFVSITK